LRVNFGKLGVDVDMLAGVAELADPLKLLRVGQRLLDALRTLFKGDFLMDGFGCVRQAVVVGSGPSSGLQRDYASGKRCCLDPMTPAGILDVL